MTPDERTPVVARVWRGAFVESEHRGGVAVVDANGRLLSQCGDASNVIALRSSSKPFQLLALVESGAADAFGFTPAELAVMAGSHAGRPEQVEAVRSALHRAGLDEKLLRCGAHAPFDSSAAERLLRSGQFPEPVHNNCSGKHAAMLALARHRGDPLDSYLSPDHPVQKSVRAAVAWACGMVEGELDVAVDGCSAPTFFAPLSAAAAAFARLASAEDGDGRSHALKLIRDAMTAHPDMVAGPERFDTVVMEAVAGVCAKGGAEGVQMLAVRLPDGQRLGIAVKISDGNGRASGPVALEALRLVSGSVPGRLEGRRVPVMRNHQGTLVGRLEPVVKLVDA